MPFWPLHNLSPAHLNRSARKALSSFFQRHEIAVPVDLRLWHESQMQLLRKSPLDKLIDSESRELYLLAMFAGIPFPRLEYGYDLGYEWYSVGSALTELDITRIKVAHPAAAVEVDQVIQEAIRKSFDAGGESQTLYEWVSFNDRLMKQHRRFQFGYEPVVQALTIRALAAQAGTIEEDTLQDIIAPDACLSITCFDAVHDATVAALEALKLTMATVGERVQPQQWKHTVIRRFSGLYAHLWLYQGHSMTEVIARLSTRLNLLVFTLFEGITSVQQAAMVKTTMANFVACYPSSWAVAGIEPGDFLGCSLLDRELYDDKVRQTHESAFDSFVRKEDGGVTFPKLALEYLAAIDQRIYSPELVDREGSRSRFWNSRVNDLDGAQDKLNAMMQQQIWHPALEGPKVASMLVEDSAAEAVRAYLEKGGAAAGLLARQMIQRFPLLVDKFVGSVTKGSEVGRLASIVNLTPQQIERIPDAFLELVLAVDLGM